VVLTEELECDLHPADGHDLSAELDRIHARMDRTNGECVIEAKRLS
jgi:hypothetical protein